MISAPTHLGEPSIIYKATGNLRAVQILLAPGMLMNGRAEVAPSAAAIAIIR
jgi:hypothetical protein